MEGLLVVLEHARLELVETLIARTDGGYDDRDSQSLALHGNAIASVQGAIAFRKKFDAM
jgi:hypothetical protein